MANTVIYKEEWAVKLQERLDRPTNWKEVCRVDYTDTKTLNNPYMSTHPSVQSGTRGAAYVHQDFVITNETVAIDTFSILPTFIDRADLAQSGYATQMELADRQGQLMNEKIENAMLASHAQWTDFDNASIGGAAGNITVSATNIDDIIRGIKREIREANGHELMSRNGAFIVWRPADFEILEAFIQANGFATADDALKNGTVPKIRYMGVDHYVSNDHTAGHVFAGVKKVFHLGICKSTWGQVVINQDPTLASGAQATIGQMSGVGIVLRADYKFKAWTPTAGLLFDVLVA